MTYRHIIEFCLFVILRANKEFWVVVAFPAYSDFVATVAGLQCTKL